MPRVYAGVQAGYAPDDSSPAWHAGDVTELGAGLTLVGGVLTATGGGGGSWGEILGTLADQADLQAAFDAKAPAAHGHTADAITSGVFPLARLPFTFARKTGNTAVTSDTVSVDVADLGFTLEANKTYVIRWLLRWHTAESTTGIMWGVAGPASPVGLSLGVWSHISGDGDLTTRATDAYMDTLFGMSGRPATATTHLLACMDVLIANGANAGIVIPRIRSEVSGSAATVFANSFGTLSEV